MNPITITKNGSKYDVEQSGIIYSAGDINEAKQILEVLLFLETKSP